MYISFRRPVNTIHRTLQGLARADDEGAQTQWGNGSSFKLTPSSRPMLGISGYGILVEQLPAISLQIAVFASFYMLILYDRLNTG